MVQFIIPVIIILLSDHIPCDHIWKLIVKLRQNHRKLHFYFQAIRISWNLTLIIVSALVTYGGWMPRNMGARTADPKPKKLEHLRACPPCNPTTSPTHQKNSAPAPRPFPLNWKNSRELTGLIMNKTIKKEGEGREAMKSKEKTKTTSTCNGTRITFSRLLLTQWWPKALESHPTQQHNPGKCHNTTGLRAGHAGLSQMPTLHQALRILAPHP